MSVPGAGPGGSDPGCQGSLPWGRPRGSSLRGRASFGVCQEHYSEILGHAEPSLRARRRGLGSAASAGTAPAAATGVTAAVFTGPSQRWCAVPVCTSAATTLSEDPAPGISALCLSCSGLCFLVSLVPVSGPLGSRSVGQDPVGMTRNACSALFTSLPRSAKLRAKPSPSCPRLLGPDARHGTPAAGAQCAAPPISCQSRRQPRLQSGGSFWFGLFMRVMERVLQLSPTGDPGPACGGGPGRCSLEKPW